MPEQQYHLLLIEDDEDQRVLFEMLLTQAGYAVVAAKSAREGLSILKSQQIDLVVSDLVMPEMDGNQFLKELRHQKEFSDLPVILITAGMEHREEESMAAGADYFLLKREAHQLLLEKVRSLLK